MKDTEKLEKRLEELQKERNEKLKKDKQIVEEMMTNEQKRLQSEKERKKLKDEDSINEIARLIAGSNITDTTIEHAREIVNLTKQNH